MCNCSCGWQPNKAQDYVLQEQEQKRILTLPSLTLVDTEGILNKDNVVTSRKDPTSEEANYLLLWTISAWFYLHLEYLPLPFCTIFKEFLSRGCFPFLGKRNDLCVLWGMELLHFALLIIYVLTYPSSRLYIDRRNCNWGSLISFGALDRMSV